MWLNSEFGNVSKGSSRGDSYRGGGRTSRDPESPPMELGFLLRGSHAPGPGKAGALRQCTALEALSVGQGSLTSVRDGETRTGVWREAGPSEPALSE